jgi:Ser-tRNA(Ala) deacylase AlaX
MFRYSDGLYPTFKKVGISLDFVLKQYYLKMKNNWKMIQCQAHSSRHNNIYIYDAADYATMDPLYLRDCYLREFKTTIKSVTNNKFIVLDTTAFYPSSGGQPHDTGILFKDNEEFPVIYTGKFKGDISHEVSKSGLAPGDSVKGIIDWNRRYLFMKYHTACHILSAVIHNETNAQITGNQLAQNKTRVDFSLEDFDRDQIQSYEAKVNAIIDENLHVTIEILPREQAFTIPSVVKLKNAFPPDIEHIRIITIPGLDRQACGGTHVANTGEIPYIEIFKAQNKGKNNRRIYFRTKSGLIPTFSKVGYSPYTHRNNYNIW